MVADASTERRAAGSGGADETELGIAPNVLAALGYVFNVVGALVLLVLEDNAFVRHHAAQSLLFTGLVVAAQFVGGFLRFFLEFVPFVGGFLSASIGLAIWALAGLGFLFLAYKAFVGERYTLPVLGRYVDEIERAF